MNLELMLRVAKMTGREYGLLRALAEGSYLDLMPVEDLLKNAVADRIALASGVLKFAQAIPVDSDLNCRQVISRTYYAMHHAARAIIFESAHDDVTSHEEVIGEMKSILGKKASETLKQQLRLRNAAEYEIYLRFDLQGEARQALSVAADFIKACEEYLKGRPGHAVS